MRQSARLILPLLALLAMLGLTATARATVISVAPSGADYSGLQAAIDAASAGDTIQVAAGTYTGADAVATINSSKSNLTIQGISGPVVLDATGYTIPNGKAIFVIQGTGVKIEDIGFTGASVPDNNGAGIRLEAAGSFTCDGCAFTGNQDGILTANDAATSLYVMNATFTGNGACDGKSHGIYAGTIAAVTVTGSTFSGTCVGHDIKSRAAETTVTGNCLSCDYGGSASYQIDLPNGGVGLISGNILGKGTDRGNSHFIEYGAECSDCYTENALTITGNSFNNPDDLNPAIILLNATDVPATVSDNTYCGVSALTQGPAVLSNNTEAACYTADVPEPPALPALMLGLTALIAVRTVWAKGW